MKNIKCYASELGECCAKMSEEHIISKSILKIIQSPDKKGHVLSSFKFRTGEKFDSFELIGINKQMSDKILCENCNNKLSESDNEMASLFKSQYKMRHSKTMQDFAYPLTLNGVLLEKWILKLYLGFIYSTKKNKNQVLLHPPYFFTKEGLDYLFGNKHFFEPNGLYIGWYKNSTALTSNSVSFKIIRNKGVLVEFSGLVLFLNYSGDEKIYRKY